ncbi:DMT family transporter [Sphingomonas profundi]|uniref:DMT family transporter n=1 Tax=Alterirhizorhabdus profundi TaxID=2681549 RepID=UPI0018D061A1|nr:hypothetical protein [Sphingomonas profundi]
MTPLAFVLVLFSVCCNALAQLLLKAAVTRAGTLTPVTMGLRLAGDAGFWGGVTAFGASFALWLLVLARLPVSVAYPLASLGYVLAAGLGVAVLGEPLTALRIAGVLTICAGVVLLTATA